MTSHSMKCADYCTFDGCFACREARLARAYNVIERIMTQGTESVGKGTGSDRYVVERFGITDNYAYTLLIGSGYVEHVSESPIAPARNWRMSDRDGSLAAEIIAAVAEGGLRKTWRWQPEAVA